MNAPIIDSAIVIEALESTDKDAVLDEMLTRAVDDGRVKTSQRAALRRALFEREHNGSTGIGNGVAIPHVKSKTLAELVLVVGRSANGIPYQSVDGRDVHTVFMILVPESRAEEHLQLLRWVSTLARNADFRRFISGASSESEIRDLLSEMSAS